MKPFQCHETIWCAFVDGLNKLSKTETVELLVIWDAWLHPFCMLSKVWDALLKFRKGGVISSHFIMDIPLKKTSNIRHTLEGSNIFDHSDVVWTSPVGVAPTSSSFWTQHLVSMDWAKTRRDEKRFKFWGFGASYIRELTVITYHLCSLYLYGTHWRYATQWHNILIMHSAI